ncbi:MAG: efflux RND transporter periplasmic adaptor subunit [Bryobacteraceae bacterium]|nr:efflux RND transporter periplasmic adaptor subunit [Bryobacteraceae bacterium]
MVTSCGGPAQADLPVAAAKTQPVAESSGAPLVRSTGTVQAIRVFNVQVPQISGQGGRITLTRIVPNGVRVNEGDVLAEFDSTQQLEQLREAEAKLDDLTHQLEQKRATYRSDAAKRRQTLREAEADLAKAELQLRKGELLSEIERLKNEAKAESARARVASLQKSAELRDRMEAALVRVAELQRDRQKVSVERFQTNVQKMVVKSAIGGMVAHQSIWRSGSMGPPQEGDQLWTGQQLVRIFDPTNMVVDATVNESDGAVLGPGARARIRLDAYPEALFEADFESASPVASAALESPIRTFSARFRVKQVDPRLLPDLSASVEILPAPPQQVAQR